MPWISVPLPGVNTFLRWLFFRVYSISALIPFLRLFLPCAESCSAFIPPPALNHVPRLFLPCAESCSVFIPPLR